MRLADRLGGGEAIAEAGGEIGIERDDRVAREAALALADGECGHGASLLFEAGRLAASTRYCQHEGLGGLDDDHGGGGLSAAPSELNRLGQKSLDATRKFRLT
jgi:hypothetical protein